MRSILENRRGLFWRLSREEYRPAEHLPLPVSDGTFPDRMATANAIAEQIWREQQLVSTRMTWNFSFQGFLVALFVFSGSNLEGMEKLLVQMVLGAVGIFVTRSIWVAVEAAQAQSSRLKEHWISEFCLNPPVASKDIGCDIRSGAFPQPFSISGGSKRGRSASVRICMILMCMWPALCLTSVAVALRAQPGRDISEPASVRTLPDGSVLIVIDKGVGTKT